MNYKKLYETIYILRGSLKEAEYKQAFNKVQKYLSKYNIVRTEEVGKRKLAYEVNKETNGYFVIAEIRTTDEEIKEIQRFYRINDDIIKYLILKKYRNNMECEEI